MEPSQMRSPISSNLRSHLTGGIWCTSEFRLHSSSPSIPLIVVSSKLRPLFTLQWRCVDPTLFLRQVACRCARLGVIAHVGRFEEDIPSETCPSFPAHINIPPPLLSYYATCTCLLSLCSFPPISLIQRHPFDMIPNHPYSKPCFKM